MLALPKPMLFALALVAGATYWPASHLLAHGPLLAAWKGAGVALLAAWALLAGSSRATRWIALVLACGALGDVLLETSGLTVGAVAFLAGHVLAAGLYWTHRRRTARRDGIVAIGIALAIAGAAAVLSRDPGVAVYGAGLAAMAGTAWISRFPRARVGAGALLFAGSDLLIFSRMGPLAGSSVPGLLIWPLYLAGQAMIACGVVTHDRVR